MIMALNSLLLYLLDKKPTFKHELKLIDRIFYMWDWIVFLQKYKNIYHNYFTGAHQNGIGGLTTPKWGSKQWARGPKYDNKMDGSVGEACTSLELKFTEYDSWNKCLI